MKKKVLINQILILLPMLSIPMFYNACTPGLQASRIYSNGFSTSLASSAFSIEVINKGRVLYDNNCTVCHGVIESFNWGTPSASTIELAIANVGSMSQFRGQFVRADTDAISAAIYDARFPATPPPGGSLPPVPVVPPAPPVMTGTLEERAVTILQTNCFACHGTVTSGGINGINDPAHLISGGYIIPGNATASIIYDAVAKGRMPPSGILSATDIQTLADWINKGAAAPSSGTIPLPPEPIPLTASFKSIDANIIQPKCVSCHGATLAQSGVRLNTYTLVMNYVSKGSPAGSKFYQITQSGEMPPRPNPSLTSAELLVISDWIKTGAINN